MRPAGYDFALGLLDLLDDYWVTCEIRFAIIAAQDLKAELLWDAYRRRLEASESPEPITYSLWVDWFEDRTTVEVAFAEVLGNNIEELRTKNRLHALTQNPLFRRAQRVLEISGPVPWPLKYPAYQAAVGSTGPPSALFQGLLSSYHDFYGDLEPHAAHALLQQLDLPSGIKWLAPLTCGPSSRAPQPLPRPGRLAGNRLGDLLIRSKAEIVHSHPPPSEAPAQRPLQLDRVPQTYTDVQGCC